VVAATRRSTSGAIRLLIAHEDAEYTRALAEHLAAHEDIDVVGLAETPEEVVAMAAEVVPDVVVLDLDMLGLDAAKVVRSFRDARPSPRLLGLVAKAVPPDAAADAFIRKDQQPTQFAGSVAALASLVLGLGRQSSRQPP
jgi:two-component system nitrate/nitrite response regulator NarL